MAQLAAVRRAGQRQFLGAEGVTVGGAAFDKRQGLNGLDRRARDTALDVAQRQHLTAVGIDRRNRAGVAAFTIAPRSTSTRTDYSFLMSQARPLPRLRREPNYLARPMDPTANALATKPRRRRKRFMLAFLIIFLLPVLPAPVRWPIRWPDALERLGRSVVSHLPPAIQHPQARIWSCPAAPRLEGAVAVHSWWWSRARTNARGAL